MLRAAVIGCGAIGSGNGPDHPDLGVATHTAAYAACAETALVSVCDIDRERAEAAARRHAGAAVHTDPAALLAAESPDLVSVCTPDASHAELVELALRAAGVRGVLAEKPLALDAAAARALAALARERGVALAVNYRRRFAPAFGALRAGIAAGEIGELQHVSGVYVKGLLHNGTHWLDLLRFLAGPATVVRGSDRLGEAGPDPSLDAELTLDGGAGVRLAALDTTAFTAFEMDLIGTSGRVRIADSGHELVRWRVGADQRHPGYRVLRPAGGTTAALRDAVLHAVTDLATSVRDGRDPLCTGEDGAAALELAEKIRAAARGRGYTQSG